MPRAWKTSASLLALVAVAGAVGGTIAWLRLQDPLAALPRDPPGSAAVVEERREASAGRVLLQVAMRGEEVGEIRFVVSLPDPLPPEPLPVVVVLGGLSGASRAIRRVGEIAGDPGRTRSSATTGRCRGRCRAWTSWRCACPRCGGRSSPSRARWTRSSRGRPPSAGRTPAA